MAPKQEKAPVPDQVQLETLPPQQLMELREGINNDIQRMGEGIQTLSRATGTFANTKRAVEELGASAEGQAIMLPLTSSLYVPGEIADVTSVMVDIGTGYYVEMSVSAAKDYCERRMKTLQDDVQGITTNLRERQNMLMHVQSILAEKMQLQRQAQAQAQAQAKA